MLEIITITIAAVFEPVGSPGGFREEDVVGLMRRPLGIGQTADGSIVVSSNRDQAEVHLAANKVDVRDLSGDVETAGKRLPHLLRSFLHLVSDPPITSFGLNSIVEFPVSDAQKVLADSLLRSDALVQGGTELRSNAVSLVFRHRLGKDWTLQFNTRGNDVVILNFNASESGKPLPSDEALRSQLEEQHAAMNEYLRSIELVPNA